MVNMQVHIVFNVRNALHVQMLHHRKSKQRVSVQVGFKRITKVYKLDVFVGSGTTKEN